MVGRRWVVLMAALVSLFAAVRASRAAAEDDTAAARPLMVNGEVTFESSFVAAVLLETDGPTARTECTGFLVGCRAVLTAAHCVCEGTGSQCAPGGGFLADPATVRVFFPQAGSFDVARIDVHPSFLFPSADVAILTLATDVTGIRPVPLNLYAAAAAGTPVEIVGFGRTASTRSDGGIKRTGSVTLESCNPSLLCWRAGEASGAAVCGVDSGGPVLLGSGAVAGLVSGTTSTSCLPMDQAFGTKLSLYRDWITARIGAPVSQCSHLADVGSVQNQLLAMPGRLSSVNPFDVLRLDVGPLAEELRIGMNASEEPGNDFDLYVKRGAPPTTTDYDCKSDSAGQVGYCAVTAPGSGRWYARVQRFTGEGDYQLSMATFARRCDASNEGQPCDDHNQCTANDTCRSSACSGTVVLDGTSCDDGFVCTTSDRCVAATCRGDEAPRTGCRKPVVAGASSMSIRDLAGSDRDQLSWTWRRGESTVLDDLGNPLAGDEFDVCFYDEAASGSTLAAHLHVPFGSAWQANSRGYRYSDPRGSADGVKQLTVSTGGDGRAAFSMRGQGPVPVPALPLTPGGTLTAQLVGVHACWEARFDVPQQSPAGVFRARSR